MAALIGITVYRNLDEGGYYIPDGYVESVRMAGGIPLLLTPGETQINQVLRLIDGIIFAGGGDIDPTLYSGADHPSIERVDLIRDTFEMDLAKRLFKLNTPVLGICRGFQLLALASGGEMMTHLPEEIGEAVIHRAENGEAVRHVVTLEREGRLAKIAGSTEFEVESKHHQAIRNISDDWHVVGSAKDGIVEAIEHKNHPWMISILWHPEMSINEAEQQRIFRAFVTAAEQLKS
jgi:putative glutamine amidotransferase